VKILTDAAGKGNTKLPELDIHFHVQKDGLEYPNPGQAQVLTMLRHLEHLGQNGVHLCMSFGVLGVMVESLRK
jgi:hypothetical protein